ncbi:hypothetical protein GEV33_011188 [Tenebrio molitor]|uniref:Uncharacterized protein n=1 Tax=Tenebrio molitor TaxID=7067 RepID=A0A8J6HB88_TENMO|nr:hypothetical protein GEV33_011188 [Tenebrio molitor]
MIIEPIATKTYTGFRRKIFAERGRRDRDKKEKFTAVRSVVRLTRRRSEVHEGRWREFVQVPPPQIAKRIKEFTTEGLRTERLADQDLVRSCQSRSSPDSPEGPGSTHQLSPDGAVGGHFLYLYTASPYQLGVTSSASSYRQHQNFLRRFFIGLITFNDPSCQPAVNPELGEGKEARHPTHTGGQCRLGQRLIIRAFSNKLSTSIREARTGYEPNIANSRDTKHFHKHIRTQLSGPVGTPQVRDSTGSVTDNSDVVTDIFAGVFSKFFTKEPRDRIPAVISPPNSTFLSDIDFL